MSVPHTSTSASETPIADRYFGASHHASREAAEWARGIERTARRLSGELELARTAGNPTTILGEAELLVNSLLDSSDGGPLSRTLRRPWQQLAVTGTPRRALSTRARAAFERADAALEIHAIVMELVANVAALRERFAVELPTLLAEHLQRARLTDDAIARLRRVESARSGVERAARVAEILERFLTALPSTDRVDAVTLDRAAARGDLTIRELRAAHEIAMRDRLRLERPSSVDLDMRRTARDMVEAQSAKARVASSGPDAQVLEALAKLALDADAMAFRGGLDIPLWTGVFAAGHNSAFPKAGRYAWRPPGGALTTERAVPETTLETNAIAGAWYAIPVIRDYVYLTRDHPSAVRVWSRGLRVGASVECVLSTDVDTIDHPALALNDIPPFFDDLNVERSAWYRTQTRAKVSILFAEGDGWFGRITQRGTLTVTEQLAWRDEPDAEGSVRILLESRREPPHDDSTPDRVSEIVQPVGPVSEFLAIENRWVRTPYLDHRKALIRVATAKTAVERASIAREKAFFEHIARESVARQNPLLLEAPRHFNDARIPRGTTEWPVYSIPFGLTLDGTPVIDEWIRQSTDSIVATLQSVARKLLMVHETGFCLGVCHVACFTFTARWTRLDQPPLPDVTLFRAPAVTRLGETFPALPPSARADYFARLGVEPVPPEVRSRALAQPQIDAIAFGAFMLDLIARDKLPERDDRSWIGLRQVVDSVAMTHFRYPIVASSLAERLASPRGTSALWDLLRHVATAKTLDLATVGIAI